MRTFSPSLRGGVWVEEDREDVLILALTSSLQMCHGPFLAALRGILHLCRTLLQVTWSHWRSPFTPVSFSQRLTHFCCHEFGCCSKPPQQAGQQGFSTELGWSGGYRIKDPFFTTKEGWTPPFKSAFFSFAMCQPLAVADLGASLPGVFWSVIILRRAKRKFRPHFTSVLEMKSENIQILVTF